MTLLNAIRPPLNTFRTLVIALPVLLTACGSLSGTFLTAEESANLTPPARAFQFQGEFNILIRQFLVYADQPFCNETVIVACADTAVVIRAEELAVGARAALEPAKAAALAGGPDIALTAAGARVAVAQFSRYLLLQGIN